MPLQPPGFQFQSFKFIYKNLATFFATTEQSRTDFRGKSCWKFFPSSPAVYSYSRHILTHHPDTCSAKHITATWGCDVWWDVHGSFLSFTHVAPRNHQRPAEVSLSRTLKLCAGWDAKSKVWHIWIRNLVQGNQKSWAVLPWVDEISWAVTRVINQIIFKVFCTFKLDGSISIQLSSNYSEQMLFYDSNFRPAIITIHL